MADQKVYIGSVGPFLYDDADSVNDPDGDFAGEDFHALVTNGQLIVETPPSQPNEVTRRGDFHSGGSGGGSFSLLVSMSDVTHNRRLNTIYHNTGQFKIAQISLRLSEYSFNTPSPTTLAPTPAPTTAPPILPITPAPTPAPTTASYTTMAPATAPLDGARAVFRTDPNARPTQRTAIAAKAMGGQEYIEVTLTVLIQAGYYYRLVEELPEVNIIKWVEYTITL